MSRRGLYRIASVGLVVGAVITSIANLLAPQGNARDAVASQGYYPASFAALLGGLLVMGFVPALYLRQRSESGFLGFVGVCLMFGAGTLLQVGFPLIQILIFPWMAATNVSTRILSEGPVAFVIFDAVAAALVSLGGVLFGVASISARVFSRWLGIGFIVLAVLSLGLGFLSIPGGGGIHMSWWWATTGTFGIVAYMVAIAWFGVELLLKDEKVMAPGSQIT